PDAAPALPTPSQSSQTCQLFVGVDVAATSATACWLRGDRAASASASSPIPSQPTDKNKGRQKGDRLLIDQTPAGFAKLLRHLAATGIAPQHTLVVLEATGNYWVNLAVTLHHQGYQVSVVNPAQAHYFAQAQLRRAKTDVLDAQTLA